MPNLIAHLGMAKEAASRLKRPVVDEHMGTYLLGALSPDIRIITRGDRKDTHFVTLDLQRVGEGMEALFRDHPALGEAAELTEPTRAFMVGYASHLLADEVWILEVYRPYFGNPEVFPDKLWGDLMDRALQLELDRREQLALGGMEGLEELRPLFSKAEAGVEVGFIPPDTLREWREWVEKALDREFAWDRLRYMVRRINRKEDPEVKERLDQMVEEFLDSVSQGMERIYELVPWESAKAFRERSVQEVLRFAKEYLK